MSDPIGSRGSGRGEFHRPLDVKFDTAGNMYVAEWGNVRVQVMDSSGRFIREFGQGKLSRPSGVLIADKYVYVSDFRGDCIVVYETSGQYVTSRHGQNEGEFSVSHLVSMVSYMYVTIGTTEFRYSSFVRSTLFTIMIMTSSVMIMTSYTCVSRKEVTFSLSKWLALHCIPHCSSVIVTFIVHYIMMTS